MPVHRIGKCCSRVGCSRPARELGGLCTPHWMGCTPTERWALQMDAEHEFGQVQRTEPVDSAAIAECCALEEILDLPSYGEAA